MQRGRVVDAVAEEADDVPASPERLDNPVLLRGIDAAEQIRPLGARRKGNVIEGGDLAALHDPFDGQAELRADMLRDELVVASNDLHGYPQQPKRRDRLGCTCLRRI